MKLIFLSLKITILASELFDMEIFIDNILYITVFFTIVTVVFLFLKKNKSSSYVNHTMLSKNEIEIKLRAYERLTLFLERIEPVSMINRLELHNFTRDVVVSELIKNIVLEYEYNISQQIYVSDQLWKVLELIKSKMINSISSCSENLSKKATTDDLVKKLLDNSKENTIIIRHAQKILKEEVRYVSKFR